MTTTAIPAIERDEFVLSVGRKPMLRIERDPFFENMWRVRLPSGGVSDMLNLTRAKDMALDIAEGVETRKIRHKSPLKSLTNFFWSRTPTAQNDEDGNPISDAVTDAAT